MKRVLRAIGVVLAVLAVAVVGVYVTSWLRSPMVDRPAFFDPRDGENAPLVFAHQGGEGFRPSNTMIAFEDSWALGADVLDTDMHRTADGVLVLIHDETVDRTSDGTGAVRDMTLAELRELDFAHRFSPDGGQSFPYRGRGHGIVTLEELFTGFPDARFGIEIKQTTTEAATELCAMIEAFGHEEDVLVSSFGQENMDAFRAACPTVATSATEDEARRFYILHRLRLTGLASPDYRSLQVPEERDGFEILSDRFAGDADDHGLTLVPWTINDSAGFERMVGYDADGINTDHPDRLIEFLGR